MGVKSMVHKAKSWIKSNPKTFSVASACSVVGSVASALTVGAFAAEPVTTETLSTTLQTALQTMLNDFFSYAAVVLPVGLTIFGAIVGISYAIKLFKKISK